MTKIIKNVSNFAKEKLIALSAIVVNFIWFTVPVGCDDLFTKAGAASDTLKTSIVTLCEKLFPVVFVIDLAVLLFDHNEKRLHVAKIGFFVIIGAYVLIRIIGGSTLLQDTITNIFQLS